jgi:hypothetical protein
LERVTEVDPHSLLDRRMWRARARLWRR